MANPTYATQNIQSNILAYETLKEYGFCRKAATAVANPLTNTFPIDNGGSEDLQLGSIVYFDTDKWKPYTIAEVVAGDALGTATAIVIGTDEIGGAHGDIKPLNSRPDVFALGEVGGMLLTNGIAMVRGSYLAASGTGTQPTFAQFSALIETAMVQVKVYESQDQFDGTYGDVTSISN